MGVILGSIFIGVTWLAMQLHVVYWEADGKTAPAVIDQISGAVFGKTGQSSFCLSAHAVLHGRRAGSGGEYRVCRLSAPGFLPGPRPFRAQAVRQPGRQAGLQQRHRDPRLFAAMLIVAKQGQVDALIPLYAIGVFTAFTLSQSSMVMRWNRHQRAGLAA